MNRYGYRVKDTIRALEQGSVEIRIVWENIEHKRIELKNQQIWISETKELSKDEMQDIKNFVDSDTGVEFEYGEPNLFVDWLAAHCKDFATTLEIVTDRSQESAQFLQGSGGVGGLMRYEMNFEVYEEPYEVED